MSDLRIVFAGTPEFAVPALQTLIHHDFRPLTVLSQPDRPAGRGRALQTSPVKRAAVAANIPVDQPERLGDADFQQRLQALHPDLIIVVAYGLILPRRVLELPRHGCWNIHASLLPRWRGAAPIQRAIEAGDRQTGVCIMRMDEGLDTGAILARQAIPLQADDTGQSLHDRLAALGADLLLRCLRQLAAGEPPAALEQSAAGVTYARKLDKQEAALDWRQAATTLERQVRAFNPWPVSWCTINGERVRIWAARALPAANDEPPGTVLASGRAGIDIATADGTLRLLELQRPGGRAIRADEFLQAVELPACLAPCLATGE
jgi:methionyl-tRNA formyltransferase